MSDNPTESAEAEHPAVAWVKRNAMSIGLVGGFLLFIFPHISPFEGLNEQLRFFQRLSEWILERLERLFAEYGYYVVFIGVLLENSMFLGLLVPGAIILILAGLAAENGAINIGLVLALAILATIIGDTISYFVGRLGWTRGLERTSMGDMIEKVRGPMESNSTWLILVYHLAGYSRVVGPAAAGVFRIPYRRWAPLDYLGGTIWVLLYAMIGVALGWMGLEFGDTKRMVQILEFVFFGVFAAIVAVTVYRTTRKGREDRATAPARRPATVIIPLDDD